MAETEINKSDDTIKIEKEGDQPSDVVEETVVSPIQENSESVDDKTMDEVDSIAKRKSLLENAQDSVKVNSMNESAISGENESKGSSNRYKENGIVASAARGDLESKLSGDEDEYSQVGNTANTAAATSLMQGECNFHLNSSLIRKEYIFKETSRNERTGRKLQFVDEVSEVEPLTITKYSDTLHYAPTLRTDIPGALGQGGLVEVKSSRGCCTIS